MVPVTIYACMYHFVVGTGQRALLLKFLDTHPNTWTRALHFYKMNRVYGLSGIIKWLVVK